MVCPIDIRYVQYVLEQYFLRKKEGGKKLKVLMDMCECKYMEYENGIVNCVVK
jgi:hypothetical protein